MGDINSTRLLKIIPLLKKAGKRSNFTVIHLISSLLNISVLWKTDKPIYLVPLKFKKKKKIPQESRLLFLTTQHLRKQKLYFHSWTLIWCWEKSLNHLCEKIQLLPFNISEWQSWLWANKWCSHIVPCLQACCCNGMILCLFTRWYLSFNRANMARKFRFPQAPWTFRQIQFHQLSDDLLPISNTLLKSLNDLNSQQFLRYL